MKGMDSCRVKIKATQQTVRAAFPVIEQARANIGRRISQGLMNGKMKVRRN